MKKSEELLNSEEVDFLLASGGEGNEESVLSDESAQEVTMRGDLDKMNLADIFQTLAMSKMEGMLRVRNPLEQREVFFRNGIVRCLVPARIETRRLGQRLIRAGFVVPEQLRSALLLQKKNGKPLGQVLIEEGVLTAEQIEEIAVAQITEDLYSLFTWGHGSFEFYRGATCDPVVQERLENLPAFEVNSVLLEVARRSDEWEGILDMVGSLDEVPIINDEIHEGPEELSADCETIVNAVDGVLSIRELADACLMSLFDCARCAKDLYAWRVLVPATADQLIDSVESWLGAGNMKRALVAVQTLYDRSDFKSRETILTMADQLRRCGESRLAARLVIEAASHEDLEEALELARTARGLAPRDATVLAYLRAQLLEAGQETAEFLDVTMGLAEAEQDEGNDEEALDLLDDLLARYPDHQKVLFRKAVVLHRMKESKAAVNTLLHLAEMFKSSQNDAKLIEVYEQILKVEYDNKEIRAGAQAAPRRQGGQGSSRDHRFCCRRHRRRGYGLRRLDSHAGHAGANRDA